MTRETMIGMVVEGMLKEEGTPMYPSQILGRLNSYVVCLTSFEVFQALSTAKRAGRVMCFGLSWGVKND